jgi:hypothetical protein
MDDISYQMAVPAPEPRFLVPDAHALHCHQCANKTHAIVTLDSAEIYRAFLSKEINTFIDFYKSNKLSYLNMILPNFSVWMCTHVIWTGKSIWIF